jgi:hypothetical protein
VKNLLLISSLLFSWTTFADYTCYPSKKNEFATDKIALKVLSNKVRITELPSSETEVTRTGEAPFKVNSKADGKYLTFDHAVYSYIQEVRGNSQSSMRSWFGEGSGDILVGHDVIANEPKGRMAIAWCYHWCTYDYYSCYKK